MDTAVGNQLMERETRNLAAHRVESREDDGLRRIVHNNLHTRRSFQRPDVTALTADDAAFHLVVVDMEDGYGVLDSSLCGDTLDGLHDNLLGFLVGAHAGVFHNLVDVGHGIGLCLIFQRLDELRLRLLGREAGDGLQLLLGLAVELLGLLLAVFDSRLLLLELLLRFLNLVLRPCHLALFLVELLLALPEPLVGLLLLLLLGLHHLLMLQLEGDELLFGFDNLVLLQYFGFFLSLADDAARHKTEDDVGDACSEEHAADGYQDNIQDIHVLLGVRVSWNLGFASSSARCGC